MIGKIIGAFVGDKLAKQTSGVGGATGAALGVVATSLIARSLWASMRSSAARPWPSSSTRAVTKPTPTGAEAQ